jgi:MarR family transcriptional regulator, transcriptional regulator for hemolysin
MSTLTGPLVAECSTWLSIVSKLFSTRMGVLLEPHGLTQGQFSILHHVVRQPQGSDSRVSEIAAAVEVEQPAVTKTLAKFQNMGLIEMTPSATDKRAKLVKATPQAGQLLGKIYQDIGPDLFQVFNALEDTDLDVFITQLTTLGRWLDENRLNGSG